MKSRLRAIGPEERKDHTYLDESDRCFYVGEYSPAAGVRTPTNDLILDLKKPAGRRSAPDWVYKTWAIEECARVLSFSLEDATLHGGTFVPAPPSKRPDHPAYDDRMRRIVERLVAGTEFDWRELLVATENRIQRRVTSARLSPAELAFMIGIDARLARPPPSKVILVDDLVTTGATFKVCKLVLQNAFPGIEVIGWFIARRVRRPRSFASHEKDLAKARDLAVTCCGGLEAP